MTEQELIQDCLRGNAGSQRELFERYSGKMLAVCRRYSHDRREAEDMLQEAFIRVFTSLDTYRGEGPLEAWIRRIVVHSALKHLKKKKIRFAGEEESPDTLAASDADALERLSAEEVLKLISALPPGYRIVFNLYVLEGYDHGEIAELLGINVVTSRSQLLRARKLLQTQIENLKKLPRKYAS